MGALGPFSRPVLPPSSLLDFLPFSPSRILFSTSAFPSSLTRSSANAHCLSQDEVKATPAFSRSVTGASQIEGGSEILLRLIKGIPTAPATS